MKLSDIRNFVEGNLNYYSGSLPPYIKEQVALRAFLCQDCLDKGKCAHCGCKTPQMFYAPLKKDALQKWGNFFDEVQWTALKNNYEAYSEYFNELRRVSSTHNGTDGANAVSDTDSDAQTPEGPSSPEV